MTDGFPATSDLADRLDRALNPRTVAVVGDKQITGYMWLNCMSTFQGKLYSVQIDPSEIPGIEKLGVENHKSLLDIPEEIDYVLCAVPRNIAPRVVADCIKKQVGGVALFTSGFAETRTEEGIQLQGELQQMAREAGLPLIGPNCMGLYNRRLGVRHNGDQPSGDQGNVGFISQSGTHCINFSLVGSIQGVKCSKTVSIGNAIILDAPDYLEYFANDPETEVIGLYLEGVKDGRRLLQALREAALKKPVVVWKGGTSSAGERAIYSHTASLATAPAIWNAAVKQSGAIQATDLDETVDVVKTLLYAKPGTGKRVGLIAMTGGQSVVITDAFEGEGLEVPLLSEASYGQLSTFFNIIGGSYRNPLDAGGTLGMGFMVDNVQRLLDILEADENVDAIVMELGVNFMVRRLRDNPELLDNLVELLAKHRERSAKPFIAVAHPGHVEALMADIRARLLERNIATFATFRSGARALRRAIDYWRFRGGLE